MDSSPSYINFNLKARYFTSGRLTKKTRYVWLVCHGYGHLAEYFKRKFQGLGDEHFLVFPEGLHRFYLNGNEGRVGASWMTKEERELDIENYIVYLNTLLSQATKEQCQDYKLIAFGFSQGAATISRWAMQWKGDIDHLTLWAGAFPPDVDLRLSQKKLNDMNVTVACGDQDEFIDDERINAHLAQLDEAEITYSELRFKGTHDVPQVALLDFVGRIGIKKRI